jgi:hypothetical protein
MKNSNNIVKTLFNEPYKAELNQRVDPTLFVLHAKDIRTSLPKFYRQILGGGRGDFFGAFNGDGQNISPNPPPEFLDSNCKSFNIEDPFDSGVWNLIGVVTFL